MLTYILISITANNTAKQTWSLLQSCPHNQLIIKKLGVNHDQLVLEWKQSIEGNPSPNNPPSSDSNAESSSNDNDDQGDDDSGSQSSSIYTASSSKWT